MKKLLIFALLTALQLVASAQTSTLPVREDKPLEVTINQGAGRVSQALDLHWKITNTASHEVVIYSSFLHGPTLLHRRDADGNDELYTSLPTKLDVGVYYFPKAEFITLHPGESAEGDLKDSLKSDRWVKRGSKIILNVSYGSDLQAIQEALKEQFLHGQGHPANPLVDWQHFARSNQVILR
jgi:hypothetical protein